MDSPRANPVRGALHPRLQCSHNKRQGAKHLCLKSANAVEVGKFDHTGAKLTLDNVTLEGSVGGGTGVRGFGLFLPYRERSR